jgi:outer membrane protein TolC
MRLVSGLLVTASLTASLLGADFEPAPRIGIISQRPIALQEVVAMVLANDLDIDSSRIMRQEAVYNVVGAQGVYDPRVGLNGHRSKQSTPISSLIGGGANGKLTSTDLSADPQLSGILPWTGLIYKFDFASARQTTNSTFVTLNPQYPSSANLSLTQPLWRGLRFDDARHRIAIAKKSKELTDEQFRQRVIDVVTVATRGYWDLDYAVRQYQSQIDAVRLALLQKESNERQVQQGVLAPIDVVAAVTQVSTFEQNVYLAQEALTRAENALKELILPNRSDLLWSAALIPTTPVEASYAASSMEDGLAAALKKRPEVSEARIASEANSIDTRLYRDQTKPQLDFVGTFTAAGLAGHPVPPGPSPFTAGFQPLIERLNVLSNSAGLPPLDLSGLSSSSPPANLVGGYSQSLTNLYQGTYPTVTLGVQMSFPIRNRTADGNLKVSVAEGRRLQNQQEIIALAVVSDVRSSLQSLAATESRFAASSRARASAEEQYQSEQRQFRAGTSTLFLVLQRQTDMITARSRELRAQADLGRAIADYERSTGETLEKRKIDLR